VYAGVQSGSYAQSFNVGAATSFTYGVVPDRQYFFAVASYAEGLIIGPLSAEVAGSAPATALLSSPGDQVAIVGSATELQLYGMDSSGGMVTFSAAGLPPGLYIDSSTGLVWGTPTTAGSYVVTVTATDGESTASQTITWTIVSAANDATPPVVTITLPSIADQAMVGDRFASIGGVATDDSGIVAVTWSNDRGGSGVATGTDVWLAGVPLYAGRNDITITAVDAAGNRGSASLSIHRQWWGE